MTPTPEQIALAKRVPYSSAAIAEAIAAAELRGFKAGVESAARVCEELPTADDNEAIGALFDAVDAIRKLTPTEPA